MNFSHNQEFYLWILVIFEAMEDYFVVFEFRKQNEVNF